MNCISSMIVGVDLGSTYSLCAILGRDGKPQLVPDHLNSKMLFTPSSVSIESDAAFVGDLVNSRLELNPELNVLRFFKREFGRQEPIFFDAQGSKWYPEGVAALLLKKLVIDVEAFTSKQVEGAVICVPAHFNDRQRKCILNAASLIDLPVVDLIDEPIAAAYYYGHSNKSRGRNILVYDFGGGTFDTTIMSLEEDGFHVMAKHGLTDVGGKELDEVIGALILEQYNEAYNTPITLDARTALHLRRMSEKLKIELSIPGSTHVDDVCVLGGLSLEVHITRSDFERRLRPVLDVTMQSVEECLRDSGLTSDQVDVVLLVGGSSMIPCIKEMLRTKFSSSQVCMENPMRAVAFGSAIHAARHGGVVLSDDSFEEIHQVSGYNLGVRVVDPVSGRIKIDTLIQKNSKLPTEISKHYFTHSKNQSSISLDLVQFFEPGADSLHLIGTAKLGPLPGREAGYPIQVRVIYDTDGTIRLSAQDIQGGISVNKEFGNDTVHGDLEVQRKLVRGISVNTIL